VCFVKLKSALYGDSVCSLVNMCQLINRLSDFHGKSAHQTLFIGVTACLHIVHFLSILDEIGYMRLRTYCESH
jgi:hypothetical protein